MKSISFFTLIIALSSFSFGQTGGKSVLLNFCGDDNSDFKIRTPLDNEVSVITIAGYRCDTVTWSPSQYRPWNECPSILEIGPGSIFYNCHGYAWAMTEKLHDRCLIDDYGGNLAKFWGKKGGYVEDNANFQKIVYYRYQKVYTGDQEDSILVVDHSAVKSKKYHGKAVSKMAASELLLHDIYEPYFYNGRPECIKFFRCDVAYKFEKRNITQDYVVPHPHISCGLNIKEVTVTNGANLQIDSEGVITILSDFKVELGSSLEIGLHPTNDY